MKEQWLEIEGFGIAYEISSFGRIKSKERYLEKKDGIIYHIREKILKGWYKKADYHCVILKFNGKEKECYVHRLVCKAFHENLDKKPCVAHFDGNPRNNHVDNVRWATYQENSDDTTRHCNYLTGEQRSKKLKKKDVIEILNLLQTRSDMSIEEIGNKFNVARSHIENIKKNKAWQHDVKNDFDYTEIDKKRLELKQNRYRESRKKSRTMTTAQVKEVRRLYSNKLLSQQKIANQMCCGLGVIKDIVHFRTYKDIK